MPFQEINPAIPTLEGLKYAIPPMHHVIVKAFAVGLTVLLVGAAVLFAFIVAA